MLSTTEVPLFATQGGGYAIFEGGQYVWHSEIPDFMLQAGAKIGDPIPDEWDLIPVSLAARQMEDESYEVRNDEEFVEPIPIEFDPFEDDYECTEE